LRRFTAFIMSPEIIIIAWLDTGRGRSGTAR